MPVEKRLESQEVFSFLRPEQVNAISEAAEVIEYYAGDIVYRQGERADYTWVVLNGEVSLRLPAQGAVTVPIDLATPGVMFGSCLCFDIETYSTTAQCTQDSQLMKIDSLVLRNLMDEDLRMGYAMQRRISHIYFRRYLETMRKLQAMVMSLPIEAE
ncbi:MAG: cyclic nucleotide-binding domain-containing protein [Gemmatimonadales bacterium]|jgi:CRP-like cAMP-binding protein